MDTIGKRIKMLRKQAGLTQGDFGDRIGVGNSTVSQYETDTNKPDLDIIKKMADIFNVSVDFILCRTGRPMLLIEDQANYITNNNDAVNKIDDALSPDTDLYDFWFKLSKREDLQLLFKQTKDLSPESIRRIIKIIKAIEDEESEES